MAVIPLGPHRGKVLLFDKTTILNPTTGRWVQRWAILDTEPAGGQPAFLNFTLEIADGDLFCAGHAWMHDGRLFVAGGTAYPYYSTCGQGPPFRGLRAAYIYNPLGGSAEYQEGEWTRVQEDMVEERWYPTITLQGDDRNRLIVSGGTNTFGYVPPPPCASPPPPPPGPDGAINTYEVFRPDQNPLLPWERISGARLWNGPRQSGGTYTHPLDVYPRMFFLSDMAYGATGAGRLIMGGMWTKAAVLDHPLNPGNWLLEDKEQGDHSGQKTWGTAVLLPGKPNIVMHMDGQIAGDAIRDVQYIDFSEQLSEPEWQAGPSMLQNRTEATAVLLPDASVLVVGGRYHGATGWVAEKRPERYRAGSWEFMAQEESARIYHSAPVLLASGSVLSGGGDDLGASPLSRTRDYQIFHPPYITSPNRPLWETDPTTPMAYNEENPQSYTIRYQAGLPPGVTVEKVVLMAPGSVTHHSDMHQRYVSLQVVPPPAGSPPRTVAYKAPENATHAPRGYCLMFMVTNGGIPSVAKWVQLQ